MTDIGRVGMICPDCCRKEIITYDPQNREAIWTCPDCDGELNIVEYIEDERNIWRQDRRRSKSVWRECLRWFAKNNMEIKA